MKKIVTTAVLMLVVMMSYAAKPVELKEYKSSTYNCAYFDWWYFGYGESGRFGYVIFDEKGNELAFTVMSPSETDMCAYNDGIEFPPYKNANGESDRDDEAHYYMSTYWVLNSLNGVRVGADSIVQKWVYEVKDNKGNSLLALRPGKYYFRVMELLYDENTGKMSMGSGYDQVEFTLKGTVVTDLKAEVSSDKKKATISWVAPSVPYGAHLYLSVQTGADVAFDNYGQAVSPKSPLTISVIEGRTYSVSAQYVNAKNEPMGAQVIAYFTVGTNSYIPMNLKAQVIKDDQVELSWSAASKADSYHINIYENGITYASFSTSEQKLSKQIPTGTYTWEVAAYQKDGSLYYPLTEYVQGGEFTTKSAALPEGTTTLNAWGMNAIYFESDSKANHYGWLILFETGALNGTGLPEPWFYIYSDHEYGIAGTYSPALGNMAISATKGEDSQMNMDGTQNGTVQATDGELKLEFEGFDYEYQQLGYFIPYYSGTFKMTCSDGKSYYAQFNNLICPAFPYEEWTSEEKHFISMLGDDPSLQGIESVQNSDVRIQKVLRDGQLYIIREGVEYTVMGGRVN